MEREPNVSMEMETDFGTFVDGTDAFNMEFDLWRRMAAMVMSDMSVDCGWKGMTREMDFSDFSGYYMEFSDNQVSLLCNGVREGTVSLESDGSLKVEGFEDVIGSDMYRNGFDIRECCGMLCRSDENTRKAVREMNAGHEVIFGMSYNGIFVYGIDGRDSVLKAQLGSIAYDQGAEKVRFTDRDKIYEAFNDFRDNHLQTGKEPVMPQLLRVFYDGRTAYSELQKDVLNNRVQAQISQDNALAARLIVEFNRIRDKLDEAAGVPLEDRPFLYGEAMFPTAYFRSDSVFICTDNGKHLEGVISVYDGKIGVYEDMSLVRSKRAANVILKSVQDTVRHFERVILSSRNVETAKREYLSFSKAKEQKYFDCTYSFDSNSYHNGVHLFNSRYKEMLDAVFIDGKFYSPKDEIRPSEGEHSVRLVFKKGVEPERLSNFFSQTDIMSINDTNIDSSKIKHMLAFSSYKSLPNLDVFKDMGGPRVKNVADMFRACKSQANLDTLQEAEKQVKGKGMKR